MGGHRFMEQFQLGVLVEDLASHCKTFEVAQINLASHGIVAKNRQSPSLSMSSPIYGSLSSSSSLQSSVRSGMPSMSMSGEGISPTRHKQMLAASVKQIVFESPVHRTVKRLATELDCNQSMPVQKWSGCQFISIVD
jgi:hypothetical protein